MNPEAIAWQILKSPDRMDRERGQVTPLAGYGANKPYGDMTRRDAQGMSRTGQRNAERRMVFDETERSMQKPVDSEFDSPEEEDDEDMAALQAGLGTGADKMQQQRQAMRMLGQNLAQQRQPGM